MKPNDVNYQVYLLRLRRANNAGQPVWRFSLERPGHGERRNFDQLAEVFGFLQQQMQIDEAATGESFDR
jgi:hypothetical protein